MRKCILIVQEGVNGRVDYKEGLLCVIHISPEYAEQCQRWACGLNFDAVLIYAPLSQATTLYLMSRHRMRELPKISLVAGQALRGYGEMLSDKGDTQYVAEWIEDAYA